jgi:hypothetical protein
VLDAGKNVQFDIAHARRHGTKCIEHLRRRLVVVIAPDEADRRGDAVEIADVILQPRAMA